MKIRHLLLTGLMAGGMILAPLAVGVASADNNGNGNGNGNAHGNPQRCNTPAYSHNPHCTLTGSSNNPHPGDTIQMTGDGFTFNSTASLDLHSVTTHLANAKADGNGIISQSVTIPCGTAAGDHTITATGDSDGTPLVESFGLVVQSTSNASCAAVQGTQVTPAASNGEQARGTTSSSLPFTGSAATVMLLTLATGLIGAGAIAVTAARRRRTDG